MVVVLASEETHDANAETEIRLRRPRQLAQFVIHQWQELLRGLRIALLNLRQDLRNIRHTAKNKVQAAAMPAKLRICFGHIVRGPH
jgi:hypothetical protein